MRASASLLIVTEGLVVHAAVNSKHARLNLRLKIYKLEPWLAKIILLLIKINRGIMIIIIGSDDRLQKRMLLCYMAAPRPRRTSTSCFVMLLLEGGREEGRDIA